MRDGELVVPEWTAAFNTPWLPDSDPDWETSRHRRHWEDIAWRVQDDTEAALLARAKWLRETTGARNLCIAGGVALNCVANGRIARESGFDNVWIQPAAGDDGIAIGCAYYGHLALKGKPRAFVMEHAYLGRAYSAAQVEDALSKGLTRLETAARESDDVCAEAEFGPRALGNRSLLADPRTAAMKDKLNARVKHRQAFRPFAPIVLHERAADIFEGEEDSPFMLIAKRVRPEWTDRIAGVVHVDGTARVQTVRKETNERLHRLLTEFEALTGVPVLINTSFNVKGEPIVETPRDAVECFLSTGIDHLVLHDTIISKTAFHRAVSPVMGMYADVASMVRAGLRED
jgi:carbamoyltransferase